MASSSCQFLLLWDVKKITWGRKHTDRPVKVILYELINCTNHDSDVKGRLLLVSLGLVVWAASVDLYSAE